MSRLVIDRQLPYDYVSRRLRTDVRRGLAARPKRVPPRWCRDKAARELAAELAQLPEHYQVRAQRDVLTRHAEQIADLTRAETYVELGERDLDATRLLVGALHEEGSLKRYAPVDVDETALREAAATVGAVPDLTVHALVGDFERHLDLLPRGGRRLTALLGESFGSLGTDEREAILFGIRRGMRPGDALLLGVDLLKDPSALCAAYDDSEGVAAALNRTVISAIDREFGADADPETFDHVVVWDGDRARLETRLRSSGDQWVHVPALDLDIHLDQGEDIRTDVRAVFDRPGLEAELTAVGLESVRWWTDELARFAVMLAAPGRRVHI